MRSHSFTASHVEPGHLRSTSGLRWNVGEIKYPRTGGTSIVFTAYGAVARRAGRPEAAASLHWNDGRHIIWFRFDAPFVLLAAISRALLASKQPSVFLNIGSQRWQSFAFSPICRIRAHAKRRAQPDY